MGVCCYLASIEATAWTSVDSNLEMIVLTLALCVFTLATWTLGIEEEADDCFNKNMDYPGNDINLDKAKSAHRRSSADECQDLCRQTQGCHVFTWSSSNQHCWLKSIKSRETYEDGVISGPKRCNDPYFGACVKDWCRQTGPTDQFTRCESVKDGSLTCVNPEIRYGTTEGGIPDSSYFYEAYDQWCQQLGFTRFLSVTVGARDCAARRGLLSWGTGSDEPVAKWKDSVEYEDGYDEDMHGKWKDGTLDNHSKEMSLNTITLLTCKNHPREGSNSFD